MANFKKISDDINYYYGAYTTFASKFVKRESFTCWHEHFLEHENVTKLITDLKDTKQPLRVLCIGSGSGKHDSQLISQLIRRHSIIHATVVEPSEAIHQHKTLASQGDLKTASWEWRQQTWQEYMRDCKSNSNTPKFHFVIAIHVLYYTGDLEQSVMDMMACVEEGGLLITMLVRGDNGFTKLVNMVADHPLSHLNSCNIKKIMEKHKIDFSEVRVPMHIDVTDCFGEDDETATRLIDFISHVYHFRETAPPGVVSDFLGKLASPEYSIRKDGGIFLDDECGAIIAKK